MAAAFGLAPIVAELEVYAGSGGNGPIFEEPVDVGVIVEEASRLVRDSTGAEVISSTTLRANLRDAPPGSYVTLPGGRRRRVITTAIHRAHGQPALPEHIELALE